VSYKPGQIIVRVALERGPNDDRPLPGDPAWTDLTDRVKGYRDTRGRSDALQPFQPGTAEVTLDNGDRALDPSNPDGLLFNDDDEPIGLPLCQVQITQWWSGAEHPRFFGYLGPEAWPGDQSPYGNSGTVTLNVMDALGHSPSLPPDTWGNVIASLHPEWWSRMDDFEFPVLDDASPVPNSIGTDAGVVEGTTGISRAWRAGNAYDAVGIMTPGLLLAGDHLVRIPNTSIMPDGDEASFTAMTWWASRNTLASGQADVMSMVHPITGVRRWSISVSSIDGDAYITTYDASESVVDTATIHDSLLTGRWDWPGSRHLVIAQYDGGANELTVWFGGISATLDCESTLYVSDLILGPGNGTVDSIFDEVATWRTTFAYTGVIAPILLAAGGLSWWAGQTFRDRLGSWIEATGRTVTSDDSEQWHIPSGMTQSLWGLIRNRIEVDYGDNYSVGRATLPADLAEAFQTTVEYGDGARWATKDGFLRARIRATLTDPTYADHYATPVLFTDDPGTLGTDEYRHAGVQVTGLRIDRVINDASVTFLYSNAADHPTGPDIGTAAELTCRARDTASIARYGRRSWSTDTEWADWPLNQQLAELRVARFAEPRQEIENIHLDPLGNDSLAAWLVTTCELELACTVTYTSQGADPVTVDELNIQHISFDWTPERWTVDLVAAAS